uniref:6-pyruvoyl tetrahydrobiopterin synthase-like n=1 Tax=Styela clava TaxID=7725 RepID=UPI00193971EE|nr:6-pyruvoyl tetrahydrobiopterin synthase-like [Styela clava]
MGRKVYITRSVSICAAHRLHSSRLSDEENANVYGKCNHIHGHGHNYRIEVTLCGIPDEYGMVMNLTKLKKIMEDVIMKPMDHKFIDKDIEYFQTVPSTAENIAIYIWDEMKKRIKEGLLYEVRIRETDNNVAYYKGEES